MKKLLIALSTIILIGCDLGIAPEENTQQKNRYKTLNDRSSSSVDEISSSSKIVEIVYTLEDVCDTASKIMVENVGSDNYCSNYKSYLELAAGLNETDVNFCLERRNCLNAPEPQKTEVACNVNSYIGHLPNASADYKRSICASFKAQGNYQFQNCSCSLIE